MDESCRCLGNQALNRYCGGLAEQLIRTGIKQLLRGECSTVIQVDECSTGAEAGVGNMVKKTGVEQLFGRTCE